VQKLADGGSATTARFDDVIDDLEYDAQIAPPSIVPFVEAQARTLVEIRDYLKVGGERTTELRDYRCARIEILNQCASA
jgi:hypothetical protein